MLVWGLFRFRLLDPDQVRATPRRGHVGLTSMSERATMADGWCQVDSHPGDGTTVRFWLPTKDAGQLRSG